MITFSDFIFALYGKYFDIGVTMDSETFSPILCFTSKFGESRRYLIPRTDIEDFVSNGNLLGISNKIDNMISDLNSIVRNYKIDEIL